MKIELSEKQVETIRNMLYENNGKLAASTRKKMREIKFRAYSERFKMMFKIEDILFLSLFMDGSGYLVLDSVSDILDESIKRKVGRFDKNGWYEIDIESAQLVLMQYTGLKDKNGVEIFEGDIIDFAREYRGKRINGEVIFKRGIWKLKQFNGVMSDLTRVAWTCKKVVGNIYENLELLEENRK